MNKRTHNLFYSRALTFKLIFVAFLGSGLHSQNIYFEKASGIQDIPLRIKFFNDVSDSLSSQDPLISKELSTKALELAEEIHNDKLVYQSRFNKAIASYYLANQNEALEDFIKNKELAKKIKDTALIIESSNAIGNIYKQIDRLEQSLDCYKEALLLSRNSPSERRTFLIKGNIAIVYNMMRRYDSSLYYNYDLLKKYNTIPEKDYGFISNVFSNLMVNYVDLKIKDSVEKYLDTVLILKKMVNDEIGYTGMVYNVATFYNNLKDYPKAETFLRRALTLNLSNLELLYDIKKSLSIALYGQKKFKESSELLSQCISLKDSLAKLSTIERLSEMEVKYETGKKEEELKRLSFQKEIDDLKLKQSKTWLLVSIAGVLLCCVVAFLLFRQNKSRQKANKLLEKQNHEILHQKKEITDSIDYAKRIQLSILPPENMVSRLLPGSFIFYKPKDVVSGDFYWLEERDGKVMFAAVDCTGHGVPGAMMSVVGMNLLNQAVNEKGLTVPAEILQHLDKGVTDTLRQAAGAESVKDGMDLSLCTYDPKNKTLQYAGAFNNLWLVRENIAGTYQVKKSTEVFFEDHLLEIKADKFPIGSNLDGVADNYSNYTLQLQKNDCVYLYSDGFADQFGGPKGKKFKYNSLKKLLVESRHLSPAEQKQVLSNAFAEWRGNLEQIDDILVIGVKIS